MFTASFPIGYPGRGRQGEGNRALHRRPVQDGGALPTDARGGAAQDAAAEEHGHAGQAGW